MKEGKAQAAAYLVEVTPVTKSPSAETLTYFSGDKLATGTFVKVPVRKSLVSAIVTRCRDVRSAKSEIRRAGFLLKKIAKRDVSNAVLPRDIMEALETTSQYYAAPLGSILSSIMPKLLLMDPEKHFSPINSKGKKPEHMPETILLQMETEERFGQYRAMVRQAFAHDSSVMFVVPTYLDIEKAKSELSRGIEPFVYVFSLEHKKENSWEKARKEKHPVLFITTPAGLSFTRPDLNTIILERENSRAYRTLSRPYIHLKVVIENLCRAGKKQLAIGDSILSIETLWREKNGEYGESALIRWRLPAAPTSLVDASTKQKENGRFEIFSSELKALLAKAVEERRHIFLYGARKGLAPTTVCGDCGYVLPCLNCSAPVVLHRHNESTIYLCHACHARRDSTTTCGFCGSWKLVPLGIGTEEIARVARELFPDTPIHILDKDHATTDKQAKKIAEEFRVQGGILVGTELAFFHIKQVPYSGLVSIDSLFSVPDFSVNERIFYLVSRLREMTTVESLIQTRNIGKQVLAWSAFGNIIDFYQGEIADRESLLYPPFSIFIKATYLKKDAGEELSRIKERLSRWKPDILKDSLVLRIPRSSWPDSELVHELSLLGHDFRVKVDPESIL